MSRHASLCLELHKKDGGPISNCPKILCARSIPPLLCNDLLGGDPPPAYPSHPHCLLESNNESMRMRTVTRIITFPSLGITFPGRGCTLRCLVNFLQFSQFAFSVLTLSGSLLILLGVVNVLLIPQSKFWGSPLCRSTSAKLSSRATSNGLYLCSSRTARTLLVVVVHIQHFKITYPYINVTVLLPLLYSGGT